MFTPKISYDNAVLRSSLLEEGMDKIKVFIDNPVISGNNIYTVSPTKSDLFEIEIKTYNISIKKVKTLKVK